MSGAAHELSQGCQLFRLYELRLHPPEVVKRFLRIVEQAQQFAVQQMLLEEN